MTDKRSILFQILFAVFDSLQGFVIVMVHCILRREVGRVTLSRGPALFLPVLAAVTTTTTGPPSFFPGAGRFQMPPQKLPGPNQRRRNRNFPQRPRSDHGRRLTAFLSRHLILRHFSDPLFPTRFLKLHHVFPRCRRQRGHFFLLEMRTKPSALFDLVPRHGCCAAHSFPLSGP